MAGKFQMCFHEKAVRSRWCLYPVFVVPKEQRGYYASIACKSKRKRALSWNNLVEQRKTCVPSLTKTEYCNIHVNHV